MASLLIKKNIPNTKTKVSLRKSSTTKRVMPSSRWEAIQSIKSGFAFSAFSELVKAIDLSEKKLAAHINVSPRTLLRRKSEGRFHPFESEKIYRYKKILQETIDLFEDTHQAVLWLKKPNLSLKNSSPLTLAETEPGAEEVIHLIGRLKYGIFS